MSEKRTNWSADEFQQEVPAFQAEGAVEGGVLNWGMSNYVIPYTQVEEEHYMQTGSM